MNDDTNREGVHREGGGQLPLRLALRRMTLLAVCLSMLLVGTWIGIMLSAPTTRAIDPRHSAPPEFNGSFRSIASAIEPAVVNISTVAAPAQQKRVGGDYGADQQNPDPDQPRRGSGSGIIVDPRGFILTNNHVIAGAERIKVKLADGTDQRATLIGSDPETDLAVVRINPTRPLRPVRLGDSDQMRVGDWVLAVGAPFGFEKTVTAGIISSTNRDSRDLYRRVGFQFFLQTDAAINRGNSGGPLINLSGEVIGINTAIATSTGDYNGVCFALPSSEALVVYQQLIRDGRVTRGFLGALTERVTPQIAELVGLSAARGAIVSNVSATMEVDGEKIESPAARAGLRVRDIILDLNGERIVDDGDLVRKVAATPVGTTARLLINRSGRELSLDVIIARRPNRNRRRAEFDGNTIRTPRPDEAATSPHSGKSSDGGRSEGLPGGRSPLGVRIESLTPLLAREKNLGNVRGCLVLRVEPGSVAEDAELLPGDVIEEVNWHPIRDNNSLKRELARVGSGEPIVFQVHRGSLEPVPRIFISLSKP